MKQFHKNVTNFQITKVGNKAITTPKTEIEQISEFVNIESIAITEVKVYYPAGFENLEIYLKVTDSKDFYLCNGLPLSIVGNKIGDVRSKDKCIISAETIDQCLLIQKEIKLEIYTRPTITIPQNSLIFVINNYKYIKG